MKFTFPRVGCACIFLLAAFLVPAFAQPYYVAPGGNDANPGTLEKPFASLQRAQSAVRQKPGAVFLRGGTYYLPETLVFTAKDSGTKDVPAIFQAYQNEQPVISGGVKLEKLDWQPYRDGIFQAKVPADLRTEEIFVNGERQILARYPNFNPSAQYFDGFAADAISTNHVARWADPTGGYFHAMHPSLWGDFTWRITGKDAQGGVTREGGWQNNRGGAVHRTIRFVENIFEELDSPGEWFLNDKTHTLYFYPPAGLDLASATVEATRLRSLVEFRGSQEKPVRSVILRGLTFCHAARTVMDTKEPLLRTDWAIYRGGAVFFEGTEDCALEDCFLDQVGGNAVFVNHYNRRVTIRDCQIAKAGASGISFVGDPQAARNPLFNYNQVNKLEDIDRTPGPKSDNYPADCLVDDCLIYLTGRVEKQTAGVEIDLAQSITVRHCSIYDMPRAGINIGDGCWGGDVIEYCDIFDTVKETGDHGSFNSWGRDRYWLPKINEG
ncbi:MAG TPA: signaling protein, partial [Verrucomicrobia subdivision 3 bacterium]|nr:signaling protein [Limisphaerales bacterium]